MENKDNYQELLASEAKHWDEFEKEFIEGKKIIPWWLDLRNASQYAEKGETIMSPVKEKLIRGKYKEKLISKCVPGSYVLDIGCGSGWLSLELARNGCRVTAIDVSPYRIAVARKYYEKRKAVEEIPGTIDYLCGDIKDIESIRQFDAIVAWDALHHFPDLDNLFLKLGRMLAPNGHLICYDHIGSRFIATLGKFRRLFVEEKISSFEDVSQKEILVFLAKHFNIIEKKYKISIPFRLLSFLFFHYSSFTPIIKLSVTIDEFIANKIKILGKEFVFVNAVKK